MIIQKTYKYRLKISRSQKRRLNEWINTSRAVYNLALETTQYAYRSGRITLSKYDLQNQLPELKKDYDWIKDVPSASLQEVTTRVDNAYKLFFKGGGFPKFAKKDNYNSITFPNPKVIKPKSSCSIILPKIGEIKYWSSRPLIGELRRVTIIRENGKYFISILTRQEVVSIHSNHSSIGIDMGISYLASLSNGEQIENPRNTLKYQDKLRVEQRSLSRKKKGSNNRNKQKQVVQKLHIKIKNSRKDFLHKQSTLIAKKYNVVAVENLNVKGMIKNPRLAKHIADVGWSIFFEQLKYKTEWYSGELIKVNSTYTSQICNSCGKIDKKSRISQSKYICTSCGVESNADINAAKNILVRALTNNTERNELS